MGHAYVYYFSKIRIIRYRKRQENPNFTVSFPGKPLLNFKNIAKSLQVK